MNKRFLSNHDHDKRKLWMDLVVAYTNSSNSADKEKAHEWADYIVEKFDDRFDGENRH